MVFRATLSNKVNFNPLESFPYLTLIHPRVQIDYRYLNYHMIPPNDPFTVKSQSNSYISPRIKLRFLSNYLRQNSNELFQSFNFGIIFDIFFADENLEFFIRSFGRILNLNLNY